MAQLHWTEQTRRRVGALVIAGEVIFIVTVIASMLLVPEGLSCNLGLSVFGTRAASSELFAAGLALAALCLLGAGITLFRVRGARPAGFLLGASGVFLIGVVATPFTMSPFIGKLHRQVGSALFGAEFLLAVWLLTRVRPPASSWILLGLMALGVTIVMVPFCDDIAVSVYGQLLYQTSFGLLLMTSLDRVFRRSV